MGATDATDAHAKNFSVFLSPGGSYRMTPLYDIVTAQGALEARQIERKQMKMAMSVGNSRHYRFDQIHGRHFIQTAMRAGFSRKRATDIVEEIAAKGPLPLMLPLTRCQKRSRNPLSIRWPKRLWNG